MGAMDVFLIVFASILSTLASEAVSWFFVYRKDSYKRLMSRLSAAKLDLEQAKRRDPKRVEK